MKTYTIHVFQESETSWRAELFDSGQALLNSAKGLDPHDAVDWLLRKKSTTW